MLNYAVKRVCWLHSKSSGRKRTPWKRAAARVLSTATALVLELAILIVSRTPVREGALDAAVDAAGLKLPSGEVSAERVIDALTAYVHDAIDYYPMRTWLHPSHVLMLGIGDCKNQASVLQALFERKGIESELVVGVTDTRSAAPPVHAWVRVALDGTSLVCDPTASGRPLTAAEYETIMKGLVDITPEYLLKEPVSARYGVGKLSLLDSVADGIRQSHGRPVSTSYDGWR